MPAAQHDTKTATKHRKHADQETATAQPTPKTAGHHAARDDKDVDFERFFDTFRFYGESVRDDEGIAFIEQFDPTLDWIVSSVVTADALSRADDAEHRGRALAIWHDMRPTIESYRTRAQHAGIEPSWWQECATGLDRIEKHIVGQHVDAQVETHASDADVGRPDEAIGEQAVKDSAKAGHETLALLKQIDAYASAGAGHLPEGWKAGAVESSIASVSWVVDSVSSGLEMKEILETFNKKGTWGKISSIFQLGQIIAETLKGGLEVAVAATKAIGYAALGEEAEKAFEHFPVIEKLEVGTKVLGTIASVYQCASAASKLIGSIAKGDKAGIMHASMDLAEGVAAATMGGVGAGIGMYIEAWKTLLDSAMHLQKVLNELRQERKVAALSRLVEDASEAAQDGQHMAAADELYYAQMNAQLERRLNERVADAYADQAQSYAGRVLQWMKHLAGEMRAIKDFPDLEQAFGKGWDAFALLDQDAGGDNAHMIQFLTDTCKAVFGGFDAMVRRVQHEDSEGNDKDPDAKSEDEE
jgi:hypothetical protein